MPTDRTSNTSRKQFQTIVENTFKRHTKINTQCKIINEKSAESSHTNVLGTSVAPEIHAAGDDAITDEKSLHQ